MKKIIIILIVFLGIINVNAASKFYTEKIKNTYVKISNENRINYFNMEEYRKLDGTKVFCIDPYTVINTKDEYFEYDSNDKLFNISDETLNKLNLIAYYGMKNYASDTKWYAITQFLIWKNLKVGYIYFTDKLNGNKILKYSDEIKLIESQVSKHAILPNIQKHYEYTKNKEYKIYDSNNVLSNYEIKSSNIDAYINDNTLIINPKYDGKFNISLIRKSPISEKYILYYLKGYQPLIYPGYINDIEYNIEVEVNSGKIILNKYDSENKYLEGTTVEGAEYGLYKDDVLIKTIITDKEGKGVVDNLELGNYYIKELKPSIGYQLDDNIYYINFNKDNKEAIVNSYENKIKVSVIINKYYESKKNKEKDAIFSIYDSNNNIIDTLKTDEDGMIKIKLPYGKYYLIQKEGRKNCKLIDRFDIVINEDREYIFDLVNEALVVEVPDTYKSDINIYFKGIFLLLLGLFMTLLYRKKLDF